MIDIYTFVEAIWLVLAAYGANGLCTLTRGKRRVDFNRNFMGKPVFGKGKTWEGLILGVIVGTAVGTIQMLAFPYLPWGLSDVPLNIIPMGPILGFVLGLGAMLGDLGGSFIKRRLGMERGRPAPLLDQEDFMVGMLIVASLFVVLKWEWVVILLAITPVLHLIANGVAFLIKVKKVPY
ncbi:MAG: CDP-2,3-bis-(O-geranylgeranyl)-sn-glycerol synthase [Candidatus Aenigmarchaeota archaeon]|nr:CDP-2,3-bis-(O-geranylgeranyl)-sn-glycerol synthase [Candidatus Aenigmarchaeota archaeon]